MLSITSVLAATQIATNDTLFCSSVGICARKTCRAEDLKLGYEVLRNNDERKSITDKHLYCPQLRTPLS